MSSTCSLCNNLPDDLQQDNVKPKFQKNAVCKSFKPFIPGLDQNAAIKQTFGENLAPLGQNNSRSIKYPHTFSSSISTDDKRWAHGVCMNLEKFEGVFKKKAISIHMLVS